jgi:aspartyl-tRNA(Asn)/glutamyl-tRNA(Gln) amidotransferase subunit A
MLRGNGNPDLAGQAPAIVDAPVIARLRAAGADVFCRAALLEYAAGALHPDIPETRNPFDERRTAGGSSGGSAALVGVGACRVALGTDTGGSIRLPAHYCGVVGFKPSHGAVDAAGVQPLAPSLDHVGLLTTGVAEAIAAFAVIADRPAAPPAEDQYAAALAERDRLRTAIAPLYRDVDALLSPGRPVRRAGDHPVDRLPGRGIGDLVHGAVQRHW